MKEISEGLRPGIPKQPLMGSCVRAVNLGPGPTRQPAVAGRRSGDAPVRQRGRVCFRQKHDCYMCRMIGVQTVCFNQGSPTPLPSSAFRCLLKQGEPKHQQTQVTTPGSLISVTALVPSAWQEVPQGAINGWDLTSRLYQFVIPALHHDPAVRHLRLNCCNNKAFYDWSATSWFR